MTWIKDNITLEAVLKLVAALIIVIVFAVTVNLKITDIEITQDNHLRDYKKYRQEVVPSIYMRRDVMDQVLIRLDRIERKIDEQNND